MDFSHLQYFIVTYQAKNITAASRKLTISQQGLSKAIIHMEKELGVPLFIRQNKKISPTVFGDCFYTHAQHLVKEYQKALQALNHIPDEAVTLRIGFAPHVLSAPNFEELIPEYQKIHPEIHFELHNEQDDICEKMITEQKLDAAFCMGPFSQEDISTHLLTTESIYALLPAAHPLSGETELSIKTLASEPLIGADSHHKGYSQLLNFFDSMGYTPNIVFQSNDFPTHLKLVQKGVGISIFPEHWKAYFDIFQDVKSIPLSDPYERNIYLVTRQHPEQNPHISQFVHYITARFHKM